MLGVTLESTLVFPCSYLIFLAFQTGLFGTTNLHNKADVHVCAKLYVVPSEDTLSSVLAIAGYCHVHQSVSLVQSL